MERAQRSLSEQLEAKSEGAPHKLIGKQQSKKNDNLVTKICNKRFSSFLLSTFSHSLLPILLPLLYLSPPSPPSPLSSPSPLPSPLLITHTPANYPWSPSPIVSSSLLFLTEDAVEEAENLIRKVLAELCDPSMAGSTCTPALLLEKIKTCLDAIDTSTANFSLYNSDPSGRSISLELNLVLLYMCEWWREDIILERMQHWGASIKCCRQRCC